MPIKDVHPSVFRLLLRWMYGGILTEAEWKDHAKDLIEASDKYGLTNLKIEAEWWFVKQVKFSADGAVEAVVYADKMNCFLLKEAAINFIVVNLRKVLSSDFIKDILEAKDIMHDVLVSVARMNKKWHDVFDQYSINDLRNELASRDQGFDGSRATLIARLKNAKRKRESEI